MRSAGRRAVGGRRENAVYISYPWIDLGHGEEGGNGHIARQHAAEFLLDEIANHTLGLYAQHVEQIRLDIRIRCSLQSEPAHLWAIAVGDAELMLARQ